jgi:purine-cytosine permease-like protein
MTSITIGMIIASVTAFLNGTPGAKHHLGYGMLARSSFGLWGSYFCIMLNVFQSFVFYVRKTPSQDHLHGKTTNHLYRARKCTLAAKPLS